MSNGPLPSDASAVAVVIRGAVALHAGLARPIADVSDQTDLYEAGMTSYASVTLMLALEASLDVEFPDAMLRRGLFRSISSIAEGIRALLPPRVDALGEGHRRGTP